MNNWRPRLKYCTQHSCFCTNNSHLKNSRSHVTTSLGAVLRGYAPPPPRFAFKEGLYVQHSQAVHIRLECTPLWGSLWSCICALMRQFPRACGFLAHDTRLFMSSARFTESSNWIPNRGAECEKTCQTNTLQTFFSFHATKVVWGEQTCMWGSRQRR